MYFGQFLIEQGIIKENQLVEGLEEQKKRQRSAKEDIMIGTVLAEMGFVPEDKIGELLLEHIIHSAETLTSAPEYDALIEEQPIPIQ